MMKKQLIPLGQVLKNQVKPSLAKSPPNGELSRLIAAAVVDQRFRQLLLENPTAAIESRYGNEAFHLTPEEKELILSVQYSTSLADFAMQLTENHNQIQSNSHSKKHKSIDPKL